MFHRVIVRCFTMPIRNWSLTSISNPIGNWPRAESRVNWRWTISKRSQITSISYRRRSSSWSIVTFWRQSPIPIWILSSLFDNEQIFSSSIQPSADQRPDRSCCNQRYVPTPKVNILSSRSLGFSRRSLGVERSRLTLPINEPERVLIHLRKCACDVQLSYGRCHSSTYAELIEAIEELKCTVSSSDDPLLVQMETYRKELLRYWRRRRTHWLFRMNEIKNNELEFLFSFSARVRWWCRKRHSYQKRQSWKVVWETL